jgi:hypothetical protein
MRFSSWWKRPLTALGHARFVEGVGFPKLVVRRFKRAHVASGVPVPSRARIEGGGDISRPNSQPGQQENGYSIERRNMQQRSHCFAPNPDARSVVLAVKGSLRRAQNAAPFTAAGARHDHHLLRAKQFVCDMVNN